MAEKLVLAYSGGLDTSVILKWLIDKGYDVIAFIADVGQNEDLEAAKEKALKIGASKAYIGDMKEEFVKDFIFPAIRANAVYDGRYLLGTSVARPLIAKKQIELAEKEGADTVAHGCTGKGNDQVRFELTYAAMNPKIKIFSPWKNDEFLNKFQGRPDLIEYAHQNSIPIKATKDEPWSSDPNIMHISYEAGELEDPMRKPRDSMFELTVSPKQAPDKETELEIEFKHGNPVKVKNITEGVVKEGALELYSYLNEVAGKNGVGRIDIVENRFVGIKSRGVYETPAGTVLHAAHRDLEGITMDREVMRIRDSLIPKFAELIYNGFWYSPELELISALMDKSQEHVSGKVRLILYKGNVIITGRESDESLYDEAMSSMDVSGGYDQKDAQGFIRINSIRLKMSKARKK